MGEVGDDWLELMVLLRYVSPTEDVIDKVVWWRNVEGFR